MSGLTAEFRFLGSHLTRPPLCFQKILHLKRSIHCRTCFHIRGGSKLYNPRRSASPSQGGTYRPDRTEGPGSSCHLNEQMCSGTSPRNHFIESEMDLSSDKSIFVAVGVSVRLKGVCRQQGCFLRRGREGFLGLLLVRMLLTGSARLASHCRSGSLGCRQQKSDIGGLIKKKLKEDKTKSS